MGCIKSSPNAVVGEPAEENKERGMPVQKKSKPNSSKVLVIESAAQSKNQKGGKGALESNNPSHIEVEDEEESVVSSRKNARKNRGNPD